MKVGTILLIMGILIIIEGIILCLYQFFNWVNVFDGCIIIVVGIPIFMMGRADWTEELV